MWQFIGWVILFILLNSIDDKVDKLCAKQGVVCVEPNR